MDKQNDIIDIVQGYLNSTLPAESEEYKIAINFFKNPGAEELIKQWENEGKLVIPTVVEDAELDEDSDLKLTRIMNILYKNENKKIRDNNKGSSLPPYLKTAAIIFVTAILAYLLVDPDDQNDFASADFITKTTARGQKVTLTLADGTTVQMNSESTLTYPEKFGHTREVTLTGEAFFMVARNEQKPFIVKSGTMTTKVLGTSFNIKAFENEPMAVTVASGKVQVFNNPIENNPVGDPGDQSFLTGNAHVTLVQGQQAFYDVTKGSLKKRDVNATDFIAWKDGILKFDNTKLDKVLQTLSRWYGVDFVLQDDRLKDCTIIGEYHNESLISVLENLKFVLKIDYKFQEDILISGSGCN